MCIGTHGVQAGLPILAELGPELDDRLVPIWVLVDGQKAGIAKDKWGDLVG